MGTQVHMPPEEIQADWRRFIETHRPLTISVLSDWCAVKAAEIGWDCFDLMTALVAGCANPRELLEQPREAPLVSN